MKQVFVLGSINMDLVMSAPNLPKQGETIQGDHFFITPGGKGANQAVSCAKYGGDVYFIGTLGEDEFGDQLINNLETNHVKTKFISRTSISTGVAMILLSNHDNRIIVSPGSNHEIKKEAIKHALDEANPGDIFVVQMEIKKEMVEYGLSYAKKKGLKTILNPSPAKPLNKELLENVDLMIVNEVETKMITGIDIKESGIYPAFKKFMELGVKQTIITLGEEGSCINIDGEIVCVAPYQVEAVDTTGAGDTYLGTIAALLTEDVDLVEAMTIASAASSLAITKYGAQKSMPSKEEVMEFMMQNGD